MVARLAFALLVALTGAACSVALDVDSLSGGARDGGVPADAAADAAADGDGKAPVGAVDAAAADAS